MRIDVDTCRDPDLLAAEVRRLRSVIAECDPPPAWDGSVCEPVAWVAFATDASESRAVCLTRQDAENVSSKYGWEVAPLYAVRLTDAEREAISEAIREGWPRGPVWQHVDTLLALLDRTK